ncbi:cationic amino acid transporter 6, chloroplastic-like isoform X2 [Miscanthus floridulus]|uniref:cationic amino acid transporter 6, chloroplastic-like isoform X2 n=1 Tax=Miscanthus floridulus TaxID=154761 RepID=UPI003458BAFC
MRAALRLLLHRVRRRLARRRRRIQLPPRHVRGAGGVPDGGEPDHGVRLLQRRRGAQLHGVPRHGGRRGRAQPVADHRALPARRVQPGGPRRRRRHPPHHRLHLLQVSHFNGGSTKESSVVNMVLTAVHVAFILFIIGMGFRHGDARNLTRPADPSRSPGGFFPHGAVGVFNGAAMVYLSYIGYDAVSTMAEEVQRPARDIPVGVSGSVVLVTVLYCLMAASMSMLLPYDAIDPEAPFSGAFKGRERCAWVSNVIGAGASLGILTSLMVAMLGQARYLCVIGRSGVMPAWLARVNPRTATPVNASAFLGVFTAALALFTELDILLNLVCIGTLFVFYMVANAVVYRRYAGSVSEPAARGGGGGARWPTLAFLTVFSLAALAFTLAWKLAPTEPRGVRAGLLAACAALAVAAVATFKALVPQALVPELWGVPGMPWVPAASVFLNVFLLGSLDRPSYVRFAIFSAAALLVYVLYSVHASYDAEESGRLDGDGGGKVQDEACTV